MTGSISMGSNSTFTDDVHGKTSDLFNQKKRLIVFDLKAKIIVLETAFLYGSLEGEMFMECPPGMTDAKDDYILSLN